MKIAVRTIALATLLAVVVPARGARAQPDPDAQARRGEPLERIETLHRNALARRLELSEDERARLVPRLDGNSEERRRLFREMRDARREVRRGLQDAELDPDELRARVTKLFDIEERMLALRRAEYEQVEEVVGGRRAVAYLVFEHHFRERVEQLMRERASGTEAASP